LNGKTDLEETLILIFQEKYRISLEKLLFSRNISFQHLPLNKDKVLFVIKEPMKLKECYAEIKGNPGFVKLVNVETPFPLVSREIKKDDSVIKIKDVSIGNGDWNIIAGPCSIENYEQAEKAIHFLTRNGVQLIRGGLFKPRTSPYSFQGLREEGVEIIKTLKQKYNFHFVSEILIPSQMEILDSIVDVWQVGTRSMANYDLLKELGKSPKPVLLKRGIMATIEEWLLSAEYILKEGNPSVILCERGIRTFEPLTRFTFDINAIPVVKELSHLPVIADPSHAVGKRNWVLPLAKAALIAGADGIIVEVHPDPDHALSDSDQSLDFRQFETLMQDIHKLKSLDINFEYE
jgi:3-deoxy-7-phosphoheptulonate synthase